MQLSRFLADNGISYREFGRRIGTKHARTVERYAKGQAIPNKVMMPRVIAATDGKVTANDFFASSAED